MSLHHIRPRLPITFGVFPVFSPLLCFSFIPGWSYKTRTHSPTSTMSSQNFDEVLRSVEYYHNQYIKQLRLLHEATARNPSSPLPSNTYRDRFGNSPAPSPALRAVTFPGDHPHTQTQPQSQGQNTGFKRSRRHTNESSAESSHVGLAPSDKTMRPSSVYEGVTESGDDLDEFLPLTSPSRVPTARTNPEPYTSYVSKYLKRESFTEEQLVAHLASLDEAPPATATALGDLWLNRGELTPLTIGERFGTVEDAYANATYEVYEVGRDGRSEVRHSSSANNSGGPADQDGEPLSASVVWETLREVNSEGTSVGRMT